MRKVSTRVHHSRIEELPIEIVRAIVMEADITCRAGLGLVQLRQTPRRDAAGEVRRRLSEAGGRAGELISNGGDQIAGDIDLATYKPHRGRVRSSVRQPVL